MRRLVGIVVGNALEVLDAGQEGVDDVRVEVKAAPCADDHHRLLQWKGLLVMAPRDEGVEDIRQGHQAGGARQPVGAILKNRPVVKLIAFAAMMSLAQGMYFSYFAIYFTSELGGSSALYGTMLSIAAVCEIPFLFFADRIIRRVGTKRMLFIICLADAMRWFATFAVKAPGMQMVIQSMNFLNILMGVAVSMKLSQLAAPQFKTTVQTLATTVQSVAALLISSLLGGILADALGIRPLFLLAGGISLLTAVVFNFFVFKDSLNISPAPAEA